MRFIWFSGVFIAVVTFSYIADADSLEDARSASKKRHHGLAMELYLPLAEQGNTEAMFRVAEIYQMGWGFHPCSKEEAVRLKRLAVQKGVGQALQKGWVYRRCTIDKAVHWYRLAAQKGDAYAAEAAFNLAGMFLKGIYIDQDYKAAADLYRQAAEAGHEAAATNLGKMYLYGRGVDEDLEQAFAWFRIGAERGDVRAIMHLENLEKEGRLKTDETDPNKPASSVDAVSGGVRQTITAVHTGSKPVQEANNVENDGSDISKSEAWAMTLTGIGLQLVAILAFIFPKAFMYGRRSWFWRELLGERRTAAMIRVISIIVGLLGILLALPV
jgi:TPR repeat protein